jgi:hypothetical protein
MLHEVHAANVVEREVKSRQLAGRLLLDAEEVADVVEAVLDAVVLSFLAWLLLLLRGALCRSLP